MAPRAHPGLGPRCMLATALLALVLTAQFAGTSAARRRSRRQGTGERVGGPVLVGSEPGRRTEDDKEDIAALAGTIRRVQAVLSEDIVSGLPRQPSHKHRVDALRRIIETEGHTQARMKGLHARERRPCEEADPAADADPNVCRPYNCWVFLKTHKTGSSTVVSISRKHVEHHGLRAAITVEVSANFKTNTGFTEAQFNNSMLGGGVGHYNSFDMHTRFTAATRTTLKAKIPGAKYFTILRDPVTRFFSALQYYKGFIARPLIKASQHDDDDDDDHTSGKGDDDDLAAGLDPLPLGTVEFLTKLIDDFEAYFAMLPRGKAGKVNDLGFRSMAFDLGLPSPVSTPDLESLGHIFDLVMIMEYFDESMVLLRRLMCWTVEDMFYIAASKREQKGGKSKHISSAEFYAKLGPARVEKLRAHMADDVALYQHFNRTFWARVAKEEHFDEEVALFRKANGLLGEHCNDAIENQFQTKTCRSFHMIARMYIQRLLELYHGTDLSRVEGFDNQGGLLQEKRQLFRDLGRP